MDEKDFRHLCLADLEGLRRDDYYFEDLNPGLLNEIRDNLGVTAEIDKLRQEKIDADTDLGIRIDEVISNAADSDAALDNKINSLRSETVSWDTSIKNTISELEAKTKAWDEIVLTKAKKYSDTKYSDSLNDNTELKNKLISDINGRIISEVETINNSINSNINAINELISNKVKEINSNVNNNVNTINSKIDTINTELEEVKQTNDNRYSSLTNDIKSGRIDKIEEVLSHLSEDLLGYIIDKILDYINTNNIELIEEKDFNRKLENGLLEDNTWYNIYEEDEVV